MTDTLKKFQEEFDADMNALDALSKQAENCQAVIDVIKKMPENNAWVVIGVGVGSDKPDGEINLRGLGCDEVAALLAVTQTTLCSLKQSIRAIQMKYPELLEDSSEGKPCHRPHVEKHYHYHFHDRPAPPNHWTDPKPPAPPDDEEADLLPGQEPGEPVEPGGEPGEGPEYDAGDDPNPETGEEPMAYADGGWGKASDEYKKYKDSPIDTNSGLNLD